LSMTWSIFLFHHEYLPSFPFPAFPHKTFQRTLRFTCFITFVSI
jgi:hypothetical protein